MIEKLIKLLRSLANRLEKPKVNDPNKKFLIQDKHGNRWYEYVDVLRISMQRSLQLQSAQKMLEMSLTKEYLTESLNVITDAINKGKFNEVSVVVRELQVRLNMVIEKDSLINMMAVVFLLEDEELNSIDDIIYQTKVDIIKADAELQDFFLQKYLTLFYDSTNSLYTDLATYLKEVEVEKEKLTKLSSQMRSKL